MRSLVAVLLTLGLTACNATTSGSQHWEKAGYNQLKFNQDNARCNIMAREATAAASSPFYVQGGIAFVGAAAIGHAIGTQITTDQNYNDCMAIAGYTLVPNR